ncbi:MAG: sugar phosphate nucleotidyltransferase [Candidatus Gastranaerophilales bacterium]|nr:sugar phosphate nucleotidyltransferase [Candidatus Gastranaerophilales bacterium]
MITKISSVKNNQVYRGQSLVTPAFKGKVEVKEESFQSIIPNVLDVDRLLLVKRSGLGKQNPAYLINVEDSENASQKILEIYEDTLSGPVAKVKKNNDVVDAPQVRLKVGKFGPTLEIYDPQLDMKIQLLKGSSLTIPRVIEAVIPGVAKTGNKKNDITFNGRKGEIQVVTNYNEGATKEAVESYVDSKLFSAVPTGDYAQRMSGDKPNMMILAGGFGTRLFNLTGSDLNKPALILPTKPDYRLMANALDLVAKSKYFNHKKDNLIYLTGQATIKGDNVRHVVQEKNLGDGGCIAKALARNHCATDTPLIILNADTFTNADITRAYEAFAQNPDAAILIPYYAASEDRASGFGLMSARPKDVDEDKIKVSVIEQFIEKPKDPLKEAPGAYNAEEGTFMANPGIYIISPRALEALKEKGINIDSELGLAKGFITPLVKMCNENNFLDAEGNPMKCYTALLEKKGGGAAYWDDLGLDVTIPETFRDMAQETKKYGPESSSNKYFGMPKFLLNDAIKNVDERTGIIYMNDRAKSKLEAFREKYGNFILEGNAIIYDTCV